VHTKLICPRANPGQAGPPGFRPAGRDGPARGRPAGPPGGDEAARQPAAADTVNVVKPTMARPLPAVPAALAGLAVLVVLTALATLSASAQSARAAAAAATSGPAARGALAAGAATGAMTSGARVAGGAAAHPVVIIGIPGLRWTDISPDATPALWRLAEHGSAGSLVASAVETYTCPADAWLTLNAGARAMAPRPAPGSCARLPPVVPNRGATPGGSAGSGAASCRAGPGAAGSSAAGSPARVPALAGLGGIEAYNHQFSYDPCWGLLAMAAGPGHCAVAAGPGAALALAGASGVVPSYAPRVTPAVRSALGQCPLAVADLGPLPAGQRRVQAVQAADTAAGQIVAAAPAGATIMVAGLGDGSAPHLRAIIVSGPGYGAGLLKTASTRQPGLVPIADLTPSVLTWRGRAGDIPASIVGSPVQSAPRGPLPAAVRMLAGQDTAAQVYRTTLAPYFVVYGFGEGVVFGLIALLLRGDSEGRRRRRRAAYRLAGVITAAVPAGSFLASLVAWPVLPHPALLLYGIGLAWSAVIAAVALAGPWRRDPLGPPGFIGAATIAVIGADVVTGSHLQLGTPFGLSALEAGRFYGIGNNAVGVYALGGLICAAWAGSAVLRRTGSRGRAVAAAGAIAAAAVVAAGWPGFGAKVGGTIAMVPGFLVLLAAIAGVRITPRRAVLVGVSGLVLIAAFAVISYLVSGPGASDVSAFVGHVRHGGASSILQRKAQANVSSLTETWFTPVVPLVVLGTGLMLAWPGRLRLATLSRAMRALPLLRPLLFALWLVAVLGWLANDSGVSVTGAALPLVLPLVIAIVTGAAQEDTAAPPDAGPGARTAPATDRAG
jgi:hypothetical protein